MKYAVAYVSRGGNTKRIADAIALELSIASTEVTNFVFDDNDPIDVLFLGSAVYAAHLDKRTKEFIDKLTPERVHKVVLFGTSAGGMKPFKMMMEPLFAKGMTVDQEQYYVRGQFMFMNKGKPNEGDIEGARVFARKFR